MASYTALHGLLSNIDLGDVCVWRMGNIEKGSLSVLWLEMVVRVVPVALSAGRLVVIDLR